MTTDTMLTTRNRVVKAMANLRKAGIFARTNFWCCQSCGCAAVPAKNGDRYVFFHKQDNASFMLDGSLRRSLYITWGEGVTPKEARAAFEAAGLVVNITDHKTRIEVPVQKEKVA